MNPLEYTTVLVTGGAGFLGSQLVKRLLPISLHVYVIDDLSTGNRSAIPDADNLTFYQGSITDHGLLETVLPQVEWVFHLACRNLVLSAEDVFSDYQNNLYGGFSLLQKTKDCCPQLKRFVYTSTASVYGNAPIIPTSEWYYNISLPYPASKFAVEHYCQVFHHLYQLPVTTLRLSNVYGPGQLPSNPYCGVVAKFFEALDNQEPLMIYGDGKQTRDYTYVEDVMDAILLAANHPGMLGGVFNVGTGREVSVLELANTLLEVAGVPEHPIQFQPKRIVDTVNRRAVNPARLQIETSWKAQHTLANGLRKTLQWMRGV